MKARYLAFFSYIGTGFRSSEKLWLKTGKNYCDPESIQGMVELGLQRLRSINYPSVNLSSRTDGGVHALCTTAHFDLDKFGSGIYDANYITYSLNKFFKDTSKSILIKKCLRVPDNFNARIQALSRTYLLRFTVLKEGAEIPEGRAIASYIPVEEWKRCHFTRIIGFDENKFREGAKHFVGYHDFTTFKNFDKRTQHKQNRRQLNALTLRPGKPLLTSYSLANEDIFQHWEVEIVGRSFVHNQIRRMVGALLSVAVGKLPPEEIKVMLQIPSKHSWPSYLQTCPPDGLYLCNVEYNPQDLIHPLEKLENQQLVQHELSQ